MGKHIPALPVWSKHVFGSSSPPWVRVLFRDRTCPVTTCGFNICPDRADRTHLCPSAHPSLHSTSMVLPTHTPQRKAALVFPEGITAKDHEHVQVLSLGCGGMRFGRIPVPGVCLCEGIRLKGTDVLQDRWIGVADDPSTAHTSPRGILQLFSPLDIIAALQYKQL